MSRLRVFSVVLPVVLAANILSAALGQDYRSIVRPLEYTAPRPPVEWAPPASKDVPLPINLPTALKLVSARSLDVAIASQQIQKASAQLGQARAAWLPTVTLGANYLRHDGRIQDVGGTVFSTTKSAFFAGGGVNAILTPSDAIYGPLAARQVHRARVADLETATNNSVLLVTEAYFSVQQARGDLAGALETVRHAEELVKKTEKLAAGLVPPVEAVRARSELARRKQAAHAAQERWRMASAELIRLLRLDATAVIEPVEPPHLRIKLVGLDDPVEALIPIGLRHRPELASQQAVVEATLARLKQERIRPLVPSLVLRGPGASAPGSFSGGVFGGGHDALTNYGPRSDVELQVVWELQNLLLGNRARIKERQAENQIALLEHFRVQDRVAAEVAQAFAQARSAADRLVDAEAGLKDAVDSVDKNFQGLSQTRRAGDLILLMVRPQEVVAAVQTLAQAYGDYYGAVADLNRAQFRLYRALGCPAELITAEPSLCVPSRPTSGILPSHRR